MKKKCINPDQLWNPQKYGFSQIVVTAAGRMVFISGQVAWDSDQNIVGEKDLAKQTQKSIDNLRIAIESVGGTLENIAMLRIYKVKYEKKDGQIISQVLNDNFGSDSLPASTWIDVEGLANEKFMIEIEAQAVIS